VTEIAGQAQTEGEPRPRAGRSLDIGDRHFDDWATLLEERFGLFIAPERRSFLASGLRGRMRETGCRDYGQYYDYMVSGGDKLEEEWALLVDSLTVHETCFFRHPSSLRLVSDVVVPEACANGRKFSAWSVGCATGEEAYSLAMLIDAYCSTYSDDVSYRVIGTDISVPSLRHARAGIYLKRRLKDVGEHFRNRYCHMVSPARFSIDARLREKVEFYPLNLRDIEHAPVEKTLNLIFCQNLLIYYDRARRVQLIDRLAEFLRPGGVLVLGPGEILNWQNPNMEKVRFDDTLAYRRAL